MRDIKFRAWCNFKEEFGSWKMCNVNRIDFYDNCINYIKVTPIPKHDNKYYFKYREDIDLMRYIGLKDKNGKEIYEKDIVKFKVNGKDTLSCIFFCDGALIVWDDDYNRISLSDFGIKGRCIMNMEVIGNTYENPELIGDK